ncbi:sugar transferase, PEP-CTERM/EpsH1 system associated [compost metagenome]
MHFEGISSGKKAKKGNVKSYQDINRLKFKEKWEAHLQISYPKQKQDAAAKKYLPEKTIVIIDSYLPLFDRESGSQRLYQLLNIFMDMNLHLQFVPHDGKLTEPYYHLLTSKLGIEVINKNVGQWSFRKQLANAVRHADLLWICRPNLNKKYKYLIRFNANIKWIYDTVDLHYIRLERQFLLSKAFNSFYKNLWLTYKIRRSKVLELSLAKQANFTIAITNVEAEILKREGIKKVWIIPNIHLPFLHETPAFSGREDLCFIGSYDHKPNVDAAYWLIDEIMPMVWRKRPEIRLYLLGNNPPPELRSRQDDRIIIPGFIEDVSNYFLKAKIFVAPLRYGAGMKGKIGQSLSFGLPIVSTSIGTEGMNLKDNISVLEANNAADFADKILRLYEDSELWNTIQQHAYKTLSEYTPERIRSRLSKLFSEEI